MIRFIKQPLAQSRVIIHEAPKKLVREKKKKESVPCATCLLDRRDHDLESIYVKLQVCDVWKEEDVG